MRVVVKRNLIKAQLGCEAGKKKKKKKPFSHKDTLEISPDVGPLYVRVREERFSGLNTAPVVHFK